MFKKINVNIYYKKLKYYSCSLIQLISVLGVLGFSSKINQIVKLIKHKDHGVRMTNSELSLL